MITKENLSGTGAIDQTGFLYPGNEMSVIFIIGQILIIKINMSKIVKIWKKKKNIKKNKRNLEKCVDK